MKLIVLETDIDDMDMRLFGYVQEKFFEAGAHQVVMLPAYGKKGRPAVRLQVLCKPDLKDSLKQLFFTETTTLGVRSYETECEGLDIQFKEVNTQWGSVKVKIGFLNGKVVNAQPEYEDCAKLAKEHNVPLKMVIDEARKAYNNLTLVGSD